MFSLIALSLEGYGWRFFWPSTGLSLFLMTHKVGSAYWSAGLISKQIEVVYGLALFVLFCGRFGKKEMLESSGIRARLQRILLLLSFIMHFFGAKIYWLYIMIPFLSSLQIGNTFYFLSKWVLFVYPMNGLHKLHMYPWISLDILFNR